MRRNDVPRRGLLLFSGGIDSTLSAIILLDRGVELISLSVDYPGRPKGEIRATNAIRERLPFVQSVDVRLDTGGLLTKFPSGQDIEKGWVPYRNLLFWAIAAHKAAMLDVGFVAAGHDLNDGVAFSDASQQFFNQLKRLLKLSGRRSALSIDMELPLYRSSSQNLRRIAARNHSILNLTWSCWLRQNKPCMKCYACKERIEFFRGLENGGRSKQCSERRLAQR